MNYYLPKSVTLGGQTYDIRSDYRAALDICAALSDESLSPSARAYCALYIFYPDFENIPDNLHEEALRACFDFINGGEPERKEKRRLKLVDWEQDFTYIIAPINRLAGQDVRGMEYMHWWTLLSFFYEIGDCTFARIVRIRDHLARGKRLDKDDAQFYRENREIVDIKTKYTNEEKEFLKSLAGR